MTPATPPNLTERQAPGTTLTIRAKHVGDYFDVMKRTGLIGMMEHTIQNRLAERGLLCTAAYVPGGMGITFTVQETDDANLAVLGTIATVMRGFGCLTLDLPSTSESA